MILASNRYNEQFAKKFQRIPYEFVRSAIQLVQVEVFTFSMHTPVGKEQKIPLQICIYSPMRSKVLKFEICVGASHPHISQI